MILFQVRDLAANSCGEPHVAPSWEIAKASLGALLAKTPELAERARSLRIDYICNWDPESGLLSDRCYLDTDLGDVCLSEFLAACRREEDHMQAEADALTADEKQQIFEKQCDVSNVIDAAERRKK